MNDDPPITDEQLTRLADGSATEAEQDALRPRIDASPELRARLREQARAVALVRCTADVRAPASLRAHASLRASVHGTAGGGARPRTVTRRRRRVSMPLATAVAVAVAIAAIALAVHGSAAPTVPQTARLALAAATLPAPGLDPAHRELLDVRVGTVPFPAYVPSVGWRAAGARRDSLHGRRVTTVFYRAADGTRVGYAVVSGRALAAPDGPSRTIGGVRYAFADTRPGTLVTWTRDGHTCVIAGRSVGDATLLALAAADERTGA